MQSHAISRRPRIDNKVVFPQPDGPAIETYSPVRISRWIPESAWVSTSSVRKTFLTPFNRIKGVEPFFIGVCIDSVEVDVEFIDVVFVLVKANAFVRVPRAGIGENYLISRLKAVEDLDCVDGALAQFYRRANSFRAAADEFEHSNGIVFLAESWAA